MTAVPRRRRRPRWFLPALVALGLVLALVLIGPPQRHRPLLALEPVLSGLVEPTGLAGDPTDPGTLYVIEKAGRIRLVRDGSIGPDVLDISTDVEAAGLEQGLLGIALHPDFVDSRRAFIWYTDVRSRMVLDEIRIGADGVAVDGSRREILAIPDPEEFHNGGQLLFLPDGTLLVGVGDGGLLPDGWRDGRDPASLLGKILRIDVDAESARGGFPSYVVPSDNPFRDDPEARPEVWAMGLRNPWRFAYDAVTGDFWLADVGQLKWEEVNRLPLADAAGANFGWNLYEGRECFERPSCDPDGVTFPVVTYPHSLGNCAVVGGPVYRGPVTRLHDQFLAADYCSGRIWTVAPEGRAELTLQVDTDLLVTSFGVGADGTVYVTAQRGELLRVVEAEAE